MFTLNCKGIKLVVDKPIVMGIINVTPDSFYAGSRFEDIGNILKQAERMIQEGASILDIGGQSTKPGSDQISVQGELKRVIEPIERIRKNFPSIIISIDTYYAKVAVEAVAAGASIVNDVSGGNLDENMIRNIASIKVPYVLMHMPGTPKTMQQNIHYKNVTTEVFDYLKNKIALLHQAGIRDIIIDPGFGFGKTIAHNFELLRNLAEFKKLNYPILLGVSRKSTIYKTLGVTAEESLNGTTVLHTLGLLNGASILRVHDVKQAMETIKLVEAYKLHPNKKE
jgi:dihydropteroate synthase